MQDGFGATPIFDAFQRQRDQRDDDERIEDHRDRIADAVWQPITFSR